MSDRDDRRTAQYAARREVEDSIRHGGVPRAPSTSSHLQDRKVGGIDDKAIEAAVGALRLVLDERTGRYVTIVDGHRGARIRVVVEVIREPRADGAG